MPARVKPALADSVMVAVYTVLAAKVLALGDQLMLPVYCAVSVIVVTGVAPTVGAVTPAIAAISMTEGVGSVAGNTAVTTPELIGFVAVAPDTVKLFACTPVRVKPALAVSVMVAVYTVLAAKVLALGDQLMVPIYCAVSIAVVVGVPPVAGAIMFGTANRVTIWSADGVTIWMVGLRQPASTRVSAINDVLTASGFAFIPFLLMNYN